MQPTMSLVAGDEATYFLYIATIAATLLGLSFVTLAFFLGDLLKRYETIALPVFRVSDKKFNAQIGLLHSPESMTDFQVLDGDPLVVFIAFSVAVTWGLFLLPLVIGLTASWGGIGLGTLAAEMVVLFFILRFNFSMRNKKIAELRPYLTREERLWPVLSRLILFFFAGTTVVLVGVTISIYFPQLNSPFGMMSAHTALALIKMACILALLLGTYTTNKDMFIFFKSVAAERMRRRWLESFLKDVYPQLETRMQHIKSIAPHCTADKELIKLWKDGPTLAPVHNALEHAEARYLWDRLIAGHNGSDGWMLDVPAIAHWASRMNTKLDDRETHRAKP